MTLDEWFDQVADDRPDRITELLSVEELEVAKALIMETVRRREIQRRIDMDKFLGATSWSRVARVFQTPSTT